MAQGTRDSIDLDAVPEALVRQHLVQYVESSWPPTASMVPGPRTVPEAEAARSAVDGGRWTADGGRWAADGGSGAAS
ncbi:hypothetical protein [Streptomyces sp. NPDC001948]